MVNCLFVFENQNTVFYAGQMLKGRVSLSLDQPKKIRGLSLIVHGLAHCSWTECRTETRETGGSHRTETTTIRFEGKEVYLNSLTLLFGSQSGASQVMAQGTYCYDFQCYLPENLPASFEASKGHIRYTVEAKMDIAWRFNKEFKVPFTVVRQDDLNLYPELRFGLACEEVKTFCCLCCRSEPLLMKASIPHGGFAAGQAIPVNIEYFNKSDKNIIRTNVSLIRHIEYNSQTPRADSKSESDVVAETFCNGVSSTNSETHVVNLVVPNVLSKSNEHYCRIVQVSYELVIEAVVDSWNQNVTLEFPITIGSVPIIVQPEPYTIGASMFPIQLACFQPSALPPYNSLQNEDSSQRAYQPPPTFDEAMKMPNPISDATSAVQNPYDRTFQPPSAPVGF